MKELITDISGYCRHASIRLHELHTKLRTMFEVVSGDILNAIMYHRQRYRLVAVKEHVTLYQTDSCTSGKKSVVRPP